MYDLTKSRSFIKTENQSHYTGLVVDCTALCRGNNKFYDCLAVVDGNGDVYAYDCFYGRITEGYAFGDLSYYAGARGVNVTAGGVEKKVADRLSHGYTEVTSLVCVPSNSEEAKGGAEETAEKNPADQFGSAVKGLVSRLVGLAKTAVLANYQSSACTKKQAERAQALINQMAMVDIVGEFNSLERELQRVIPRQMGSVEGYMAHSCDDFERIINREQSLLDALTSVQDRGHILDTEAGNLQIEEASPDDLKVVKKALGASAPRLVRAWKVDNHALTERFCQYRAGEKGTVATQLLWHGTRGENVWSILNTGLVIRPQAITTGKMFGWGMYFAPTAEKSIGYTDGGKWTCGVHSDKEGGRFLILNEVATGNSLEIHNSNEYLAAKLTGFERKMKKEGCQSVKGCAGAMLRMDEIIVYDEAQIRPCYLVEVK